MTCGHSYFSHYKSYQKFDHYFSAPIQLLIFLRQFISYKRYLIPFLVPINLSLHIPLGAYYAPVNLNVPITHYGISQPIFLLYHIHTIFDIQTLSFISSSVYNILTIDILQTPDLSVYTFNRLHRASDISVFTYIRQSEYQGEYFKALPYHSTLQFIS